jgi:hypothetical protein
LRILNASNSGPPPSIQRLAIEQLYVPSRLEMGPLLPASQLHLCMLAGPYGHFVFNPYKKIE